MYLVSRFNFRMKRDPPFNQNFMFLFQCPAAGLWTKFVLVFILLTIACGGGWRRGTWMKRIPWGILSHERGIGKLYSDAPEPVFTFQNPDVKNSKISNVWRIRPCNSGFPESTKRRLGTRLHANCLGPSPRKPENKPENGWPEGARSPKRGPTGFLHSKFYEFCKFFL